MLQDLEGNTKICITSCDGWIGYTLALHLHQKYGNKVQVFCTARDPSRCEGLKKEGLEVRKVSYEDKNSLQSALNNIQTVIYVPEMNEKMVEWASVFAQAMESSRIQSAIIVSCIGAEGEKSNLKKFGEMEVRITEKVPKWTILRKSMLHQNFFLWSKCIQESKEFPLTAGQQRGFAPINLTDFCRAIIRVANVGENRPQDGIPKEHCHVIYNLTGPHRVTGPELVKELNEVVGTQISYKDVNRQVLEKYLQSQQHHPGYYDEPNKGVPEDDKEKRLETINQTEISAMLDYFDLVKEGRLDYLSTDLKKITGDEGVTLKKFFERNSSEFRPRKWLPEVDR